MLKRVKKESLSRKESFQRKETALDRYVRPYVEQLLSGTVLAIDPSSGSESSQPGYSCFRAGVLLEAGTIEVGSGGQAHGRFYELRRTLMEDFEVPDVLVVENIAPMIGRGMHAGVINLHRSIGVIISIFPCPVVWISPSHWQKHVEKSSYPKSDCNDSVMIGYAAIAHAAVLQGRPCPISAKELHSWIYKKTRDI